MTEQPVPLPADENQSPPAPADLAAEQMQKEPELVTGDQYVQVQALGEDGIAVGPLEVRRGGDGRIRLTYGGSTFEVVLDHLIDADRKLDAA